MDRNLKGDEKGMCNVLLFLGSKGFSFCSVLKSGTFRGKIFLYFVKITLNPRTLHIFESRDLLYVACYLQNLVRYCFSLH